MKIIAHNPLDNVMEKYANTSVTPGMLMEYCEYDIVKADEYLRNWAIRHENDCHIVSNNPLTVKITLTPADTKNYNKNMREKRRHYKR